VDDLHGCCHRYPARYTGEGDLRDSHRWRFPAVSIHNWCGEFVRLPVDQMSSTAGTS
jgi:hypothetical protein